MCKRLLLLHGTAATEMLSPAAQQSGSVAGRNPALATAALRQLTPALAAAVPAALTGTAAHDSRNLLPVQLQ